LPRIAHLSLEISGTGSAETNVTTSIGGKNVVDHFRCIARVVVRRPSEFLHFRRLHSHSFGSCGGRDCHSVTSGQTQAELEGPEKEELLLKKLMEQKL
jgi:hypothetical protein